MRTDTRSSLDVKVKLSLIPDCLWYSLFQVSFSLWCDFGCDDPWSLLLPTCSLSSRFRVYFILTQDFLCEVSSHTVSSWVPFLFLQSFRSLLKCLSIFSSSWSSFCEERPPCNALLLIFCILLSFILSVDSDENAAAFILSHLLQHLLWWWRWTTTMGILYFPFHTCIHFHPSSSLLSLTSNREWCWIWRKKIVKRVKKHGSNNKVLYLYSFITR